MYIIFEIYLIKNNLQTVLDFDWKVPLSDTALIFDINSIIEN
jgi:hypothetical protein